MPITTAGILLYRFEAENLQVLLVHPGGPFWAKKDEGAWSIPKGELNEGEDKLEGAKREFSEETGSAVLTGEFISLKPVKSHNKIIYAFAIERDFNPSVIQSNLFEMEWPPKSGKMKEFPEVDRAEWFDMPDAMIKINKFQVPILQELNTIVAK
jgi:predicted NUDIX family NTP pyrophosphohydrolase